MRSLPGKQASSPPLASVFVVAAAALAWMASAPDAAAQEDVSLDLFGGVTAPVGGLAEVTTRAPAVHYGLGLSVPVSGGWELRIETSLHEFSECQFGATTASGHLQLR